MENLPAGPFYPSAYKADGVLSSPRRAGGVGVDVDDVGVNTCLVKSITQEGNGVDLSYWYQGCIYKKSRSSSNLGDLDPKVKVTGQIF